VRLTTARRLRETPVDCARWAGTDATGSLEDLENSHLKRYSAFIRGTGYESPPQTFDRAADLLRSYRLFPPDVIEATVCWPDARVAPGAVVVQRSFIGPLAVESAVRIEDLEDDLTFAGRRVAFSAVTLRGHPLRGAETVELLMHETGRIELHFTSAARPAGWLARLGGPFTRWMQVRANRAALAYFRTLVAETGPRAEPPSPRNADRLTLWETAELLSTANAEPMPTATTEPMPTAAAADTTAPAEGPASASRPAQKPPSASTPAEGTADTSAPPEEADETSIRAERAVPSGVGGGDAAREAE
jgi:uncharacterized protein (UPF0548 family)